MNAINQYNELAHSRPKDSNSPAVNIICPKGRGVESLSAKQGISRKIVYKWYALYTKSRQEKKVSEELQFNGIESYLPLVTTVKQWSDRKKKVEEPLIRSYVFVKSSEKEYYKILNTTGVVKYITFEGKAAPIPEWQIDAMKKMIDYNQPHYYSTQNFLKGEKIKITQGPLQGYEGEVVRDINGKKKVIIRISNIGYSLVIETPVSIVMKTS